MERWQRQPLESWQWEARAEGKSKDGDFSQVLVSAPRMNPPEIRSGPSSATSHALPASKLGWLGLGRNGLKRYGHDIHLGFLSNGRTAGYPCL